MSIVMASIDHTTASLSLREKFSFTANRIRSLLPEIRRTEGVLGAALLCTCNRTELYLSCDEKCEADPVEILCESAGQDRPASGFAVKREEEAAAHLMEVACGLRSMIRGEDQIITQVGSAALQAREAGGSDAVLETLFRLGVTAAKKVKTLVRVRPVPPSAAAQAVKTLGRCAGELRGKRALVIGGGETGRLAAQALREAGCDVTVTLRTYKHGEAKIPPGCKTVRYDRRAELLSQSDIVLSATASPHLTVSYDMIAALPHRPSYIVDLAVPRDIDPEIEKIGGVRCFNIDSIGGAGDEDADEMEQVRRIIGEHIRQFGAWLRMRECARLIPDLRRQAVRRVREACPAGCDERLVELAAQKTFDLLIYSLGDELSPEMLAGLMQRARPRGKGGST